LVSGAGMLMTGRNGPLEAVHDINYIRTHMHYSTGANTILRPDNLEMSQGTTNLVITSASIQCQGDTGDTGQVLTCLGSSLGWTTQDIDQVLENGSQAVGKELVFATDVSLNKLTLNEDLISFKDNRYSPSRKASLASTFLSVSNSVETVMVDISAVTFIQPTTLTTLSGSRLKSNAAFDVTVPTLNILAPAEVDISSNVVTVETNTFTVDTGETSVVVQGSSDQIKQMFEAGATSMTIIVDDLSGNTIESTADLTISAMDLYVPTSSVLVSTGSFGIEVNNYSVEVGSVTNQMNETITAGSSVLTLTALDVSGAACSIESNGELGIEATDMDIATTSNLVNIGRNSGTYGTNSTTHLKGNIVFNDRLYDGGDAGGSYGIPVPVGSFTIPQTAQRNINYTVTVVGALNPTPVYMPTDDPTGKYIVVYNPGTNGLMLTSSAGLKFYGGLASSAGSLQYPCFSNQFIQVVSAGASGFLVLNASNVNNVPNSPFITSNPQRNRRMDSGVITGLVGANGTGTQTFMTPILTVDRPAVCVNAVDTQANHTARVTGYLGTSGSWTGFSYEWAGPPASISWIVCG
jgi:hypothetical protein